MAFASLTPHHSTFLLWLMLSSFAPQRPMGNPRVPLHRQPARHSFALMAQLPGQVARRNGSSHRERRHSVGEMCHTAGGDQLDFRGVWAWDANNAMVMSAGPGDQSRIYETSDGCAHWTEERRNSEKDGFWDAMVFQSRISVRWGLEKTGMLIGDPVGGRFHTEAMILGHGWLVDDSSCARATRRGSLRRQQFFGLRVWPAQIHYWHGRKGRAAFFVVSAACLGG